MKWTGNKEKWRRKKKKTAKKFVFVARKTKNTHGHCAASRIPRSSRTDPFLLLLYICDSISLHVFFSSFYLFLCLLMVVCVVAFDLMCFNSCALRTEFIKISVVLVRRGYVFWRFRMNSAGRMIVYGYMCCCCKTRLEIRCAAAAAAVVHIICRTISWRATISHRTTFVKHIFHVRVRWSERASQTIDPSTARLACLPKNKVRPKNKMPQRKQNEMEIKRIINCHLFCFHLSLFSQIVVVVVCRAVRARRFALLMCFRLYCEHTKEFLSCVSMANSGIEVRDVDDHDDQRRTFNS